MLKHSLPILLLLTPSAFADQPPRVGPLMIQNNLGELATAGTQGTARTNLGLGSASTLSSAAVLQTFNNLAEIAAAGPVAQAAALANLGAGKADARAINVAQNGVVCDGVTDNQAAINTINGLATTGSTIYFPPAALPCLTSRALAPASGVTVWAFPGTATLKPTPGSTANPVLFAAVNKSSVLVYGLTIDGGGVDFPTGNNVATIFQSTSVVFDHVRIQNTRGIGALFSTSNVTSGIRDSFIYNVGNHWVTSGQIADQKQGVAFCCGVNANSHGNFATGNYFELIGLDAVSVTNNQDFLATNNIFKNVGGTYLQGGAAVYASNNGSITANHNSVNGTYGNGIDVINTNFAVINSNNIQFAGGSGISYALGSWATITGNVAMNNGQSVGSGLRGGVSLNGNGTPVTEVIIANNMLGDNQGTPTQQWGIQGYTGGTYTNIWIDQSNTLDGNVLGPFGQAFSSYTPLKIGATVQGFTTLGTAPNVSVALEPTGTGYVSLSVPDGTITNGNTPGNQALSYSLCRLSPNHVASAPNSTVLGGCNNQASGQFATTVGGEWNVANGPGSLALGLFASTKFRPGTMALANGQFANIGDGQQVDGPHLALTTTATPLTTLILSLGQTSINVNTGFYALVRVIARSSLDMKTWECDAALNSFGGPSTVVFVGSPTCTNTFATAGASAWTLSLAADTSTGGLSMVTTGATSTTVRWVSRIIGLEVNGP